MGDYISMPSRQNGVRSLVVTQQLPLPIRSGADLRSLSTIEALAAAGPVAVFGIYPTPPAPSPHPRIEAWRASSDATLTDPLAQARVSLRWLREPDGHPSDRWFSPGAARELSELAESFQPDVVVLDHVWQHRYLAHVQGPGRVTVLHSHNIEGALHRELADGAVDGRVPANLARVVAERAERLERATVDAVDQTWVPSPRDAGLLAELYGNGRQVHVVPSGVDPGRYAGSAAREPHLMVYPARFDYPPNTAAARRLARRVLPAVREQVADARLALVGGGAIEGVQNVDGVEVVGPVPDVAPFLARASVMPVALDEGGGTRLKVLEAFAARVPVVSTRKGVEGLDVTDGKDVLIADSDEGIVEAVLRVWTDHDLARRLADAGFALVRSTYGPEAVARAVAGALGHCAS
jgi:glycosyltransferase involved in cell wall biosynthesis